jgi:hypothetical protein
MEGWVTALFTLSGVLAGGFFSYLGMKKQLEQRGEIDSRQWRRKVRSEPLLKLRAEVAIMATKQYKLVAFTYRYREHARIGISEEVAKKELQETADDCNDYLASGEFAQALFMQSDVELMNKAREILNNYQKWLTSAMYYTSEKALQKSLDLIEKNTARITEVQELINKRLEEL